MKKQELEELSDFQLQAKAYELGIENAVSFSREKLIKALMTFPENRNIEEYIDKVSVGDIVAFRTSDFSVKSAKVVRKSSADKKFLLETKYSKQFFVDFNDVLWVNTNGYWPKWIYNLMKEKQNAEAKVVD